MTGIIYCFNTVGDSKLYKAGHTTNKLEKRLAGYLGPSKPRSIIFSRTVKNSHMAEKLMLKLMRQCMQSSLERTLEMNGFKLSRKMCPPFMILKLVK